MRNICGKGNRSDLGTIVLSGVAVEDLQKEVAAEHPDSIKSNGCLRIKSITGNSAWRMY